MPRDPRTIVVPVTRRTFLAACGAGLAGCAASVREPVPILVGSDTCAFCRMTILDDRVAAEYLLGGRALKFDDVGCVRDYALANDPARSGRAFVRDYAGSGFLPVEVAVLVAGAVETPMSTNVVAFGTDEAAAALVRARGGVRIGLAEVFGPAAVRGRRYAMAGRAAAGGHGASRHE